MVLRPSNCLCVFKYKMNHEVEIFSRNRLKIMCHANHTMHTIKLCLCYHNRNDPLAKVGYVSIIHKSRLFFNLLLFVNSWCWVFLGAY